MVFAAKARKIYPYLKGILLTTGYFWCLDSYLPGQPRTLAFYLLLLYSVIILTFEWLHKRSFLKLDTLYFSSQFFDALIIAAVINLTGGLGSEFYLAFFPTVALAAVFVTDYRAIVSALWYGFCFMAAVYTSSFSIADWQLAAFRLMSIWSVGLVAYSVAHLTRSSEKKLLKTLDILNERTWELETSQAQISDIYETSRVLSGILDLEHLLGEILRVAERIFRLKTCRIFLSNVAGDCLFLYAQLQNGNRHIYEEPVPHQRDISYIMGQGKNPQIGSIKQNKQEKEAGQVDIPLLSRGNVIGIVQVVPASGTLSSSKDKRFLMVFASAIAVAIDNSLLHKQTEELTVIDALTELYNYRYFHNKLTDELRRADRYRQKLSIMMMDLDHFKEINDRYGHQTGNVILREIANIIKQCVRDIDVVARYGGEEFVVILPQTDSEDAQIIAERTRETAEKNLFSDSQGRKEIRLTVSIGVATYPDGVYSLDQLLENVDKALYRAKAGGRNAVIIAEKAQKRTADIS